MKYLKQPHLVCFSVEEIKQILRDEFKRVLFDGLAKQKIDLSSFKDDRKAMEDFVSGLVKKNSKRKEFVELFFATELADSIYASAETMTCFELKKSIQPNSLVMPKTYQELVDILEENTILDFAIFNKDGLRQVQLKQYKGSLETDKVAEFIKDKLEGYGSLGQVNLLVMLQGPDNDGSKIMQVNIDFEKIHNVLKDGKFKTEAEVLIAMNDRNEEQTVTQVYPKLNQFRIKTSMPSSRW